ncbi:MAG TPA: type II toxin-antitoxin system VapC family toxin [Gemmataceae bacterium]|nr:type II toxin-antitoxin system VapC family toxin [Gemmataceae bacterium]
MTFLDLPSGQAVFVDANIFLYYFRPDPILGPPCDQLLQRIENGDIQGYTSAHVLNEMVHRLMTEEAHQRFGWPMNGMARRLRTHPAQVRSLSRPRQAIDELTVIGLQILPITGGQVSRSVDHSNQHGLLSSDALIVSVMQHHGLQALASHDADFDRVPGLTRYAPV